MTKAKIEQIKKEYNMTDDEIDKAIGVVIALIDAEIEELEKERFACDEIGALDRAADEVASLIIKLEEVM